MSHKQCELITVTLRVALEEAIVAIEYLQGKLPARDGEVDLALKEMVKIIELVRTLNESASATYTASNVH